MAFLTPPVWLENSSAHNAQDYRVMLASLLAGGDPSGVAGFGHLKVTERAGTPNLSVDVAAGGAFIASTRSAAQGVYHAYNDAPINVPLAAADPTNPRIDRILIQVRDEAQDAALSQNDARILVVQGTPAASPVAPTITVADYIQLAHVVVPAGATSVSNANIVDFRTAAEPWRRPRGELGAVENPNNQSTIGTTPTLLTGLTVTVNIPEGRTVRISGNVQFVQRTSAGNIVCDIREDGNVIGRLGITPTLGVNQRQTMGNHLRRRPPAGTRTYTLVASTSTATCDAEATATQPKQVIVEDIGGYV